MNSNLKAVEAVYSKPVDELNACVQEWSKQDNERNMFCQLLLQRLANTEDKTRRLEMELDAQITSRCQFQERISEITAQNKEYEYLLTKDPYVAVLIDGDGAIFQDNLLHDPDHGAAEASRSLKQHIIDYLTDRDVTIFARVFTNIKGLARALRLSGIIASDDDLYKFAEKFTNSRAEFDFVNVGPGKENADMKIRRMLKYYHDDVRCKKIFFVACHDGGYAHDLRPYTDKQDNRLVLVETTPVEQNIKSLGLPTVHFDKVFRNRLLQDNSNVTASLRPSQSTLTSSYLASSRLPATTSASTPPPVTSDDDVSKTSTGSYAAVTGEGGHQSTEIRQTKVRQPKTFELNKNNIRLDPPVKNPGYTTAQESYKMKLSKAKGQAFCNNYYFTGFCHYGNKCAMEHNVKLTTGELDIQRYKARTSPCHNGPKCADFYCLRSHHCPLDPYCGRGTFCKFKKHEVFGDMHLTQEDLKPVKRWTEGSDFPEPIKN